MKQIKRVLSTNVSGFSILYVPFLFTGGGKIYLNNLCWTNNAQRQAQLLPSPVGEGRWSCGEGVALGLCSALAAWGTLGKHCGGEVYTLGDLTPW